MALRWQIPFTSLAGTSYTVNIYDDSYSGSPTTLTGAPNPFETYEDDVEDPFTPLRGQSGYLRVIDTDGSLVEQIVPENNTSLWVVLLIGGTIMWRGYLQAQVFTQPWDAGAHILEIPVRSYISCLSDVYPDEADAGKISRLGALIYDAFTAVAPSSASFDPFTAVNVVNDALGQQSSQFLFQKIRRSDFYDDQEIVDQGVATRSKVGKSWADVLSSILSTFGLTAREDGMYLYLAQYDHPGFTAYRYSYSWQVMSQMESGSPSLPTGNALADSAFFPAATFAGAGHEVSLLPGAREASINVKVGDPRLSLLVPAPVEQTSDATTDIGVNTGQQVAFQAYQADNAIETFAFRRLSPVWRTDPRHIEYTDQGAGTYAQCLANCIINDPTYNPIAYVGSGILTTGAIPVRFSQGTSANPGSLSDGLLLNLQVICMSSDQLSTVTHIYQLTSPISYQFRTGCLNIRFRPLFFMRDKDELPAVLHFDETPDGFDQNIDLYFRIKIGNKYYNSITKSWSTTSVNLSIPTKGGEIVPNKTNRAGDLLVWTPETDGYFIPVTPDLSGQVTLEIDDYAYTYSQDHQYDIHAVILTGLEVSYLPYEGIVASDRDENTYRKIIMASGFRDRRAMELSVGTMNNNRPSANMLLTPSGDYLQVMTYDGIRQNRTERPEIHLLTRFSTWLSKMRRAYYAEVSSGLSLCDRRYTIDSKPYVAIDSRHEWINDRQRLRLIELAGDNE